MHAIAGALMIALAAAAAQARADDTVTSVVALHAFKGTRGGGIGPDGALVQASDGRLYGTTSAGGFQSNGTIFRIGLDGQFESIAGFTLDEGTAPVGDLVDGGDGYLYGVTNDGGAFDGGTIYRTTLDGAKTVLYSFDPGGWGGSPMNGLAASPDGAFYGVLFYARLLYRIARDGSWTPVAILPGEATSRPVVGEDGNVYVPIHDPGELIKVQPDGKVQLFHSLVKKELAPSSLTLGRDGSFYGTADSRKNCGVVYRVTAGGVESNLHEFECTGGYDHLLPGVVQSTDGSLVGTAFHQRVGAYHYTVWTMAADGTGFTETTMPPHAGNGANTLIQATDGAFYGTAPGGKFNAGTIVKIVP